MNNTKSRTVGQRVLSVLIAICVWMPDIGLGIHLAVPIKGFSMADAMGMALIFFWLLKIELFGILLLVVYAFWVKPWKHAGRVSIIFKINVYGASASFFLFANFIFGWCRLT